MCPTFTRKYILSGEIYTIGKNFTLPPAVTGVTNIISATWNHHLAGAGEEESFLNRRSPLLLQSGEVVQAVAVSHLEIWIDYNLLTIVGIFKSMFIQII